MTVYNIAFGMEFDILFLSFLSIVLYSVLLFWFLLGGRTTLGRFENMLLCYAVAHLSMTDLWKFERICLIPVINWFIILFSHPIGGTQVIFSSMGLGLYPCLPFWDYQSLLFFSRAAFFRVHLSFISLISEYTLSVC